MKKALFLLLVLVLVFVLWKKPEVQPVNEETVATEQLRSVATAPVAVKRAEAAKAETANAAESTNSDQTGALPAVAPAKLFPHARVVAQVEVAGERGQVKLIKTVETNRKEKFIRIEETYADGQVNGANLVRESAMVANQLLTQKPETMAEDSFVRILSETGASEIKKIGEAFLVTFRAEPENPRALDGYIAKLKAALGSAVVEPNYIRHLL